MTFLLEWGVAWFRTKPRASKKRKSILRGIPIQGQSVSIDVFYVGAFWGEESELDRFKHAYAVEKTKLELRKQGETPIEQPLADGWIRVRAVMAA